MFSCVAVIAAAVAGKRDGTQGKKLLHLLSTELRKETRDPSSCDNEPIWLRIVKLKVAFVSLTGD